MTLATKERIASRRQVSTDRFIRSTHPILYISMRRDGDQFLSDDARGYLCEVTGTIWGIWRRYFDGSDDNIILPNVAALQPANGTIIIWMRTDGLAGTRYLISTNSDKLSILRVNNTTDIALYYNDASPFTMTGTSTNAQWVCVGITFAQGGTGYGYENGIQQASGACSGTAPTSGSTRIGTISTAAAYFHKGDIGEVIKWPRDFNATQMLDVYLATRWRYK